MIKDWSEEFVDFKITKISRMKKIGEKMGMGHARLYRLPTEDMIRVLNIDPLFGEIKLGTNSRRILKSKFIFQT